MQSIAAARRRLERIPGLESGLFAVGRKRYADLYEEEAPQVRALLLDAHTLMAEAKHFQNLHRQEARLRRHYEKDMQELRKLQAERQMAEQVNSRPSTKLNGFEFTNAESIPNNRQTTFSAGRNEDHEHQSHERSDWSLVENELV